MAEARRRAPRSDDEPGYVELLSDPAVEPWLRPPPLQPFTPAAIGQLLAEDVAHWQQAGFGLWVLVDEEEAVIGRAGIRNAAIGGEWTTELAWAIAPAQHGRGLATSSALAAIDLARSLGIGELVAVTLPHNTASRRVAEKAGMRLDGEVEHAGLRHVRYRRRLQEGDPS